MATVDIICCYCGTKQGEKEGFNHYDPDGTSTICPPCHEKEQNATQLPNGKLVYVSDGRAWERLPGSFWREIDIAIIKATMPELLK